MTPIPAAYHPHLSRIARFWRVNHPTDAAWGCVASLFERLAVSDTVEEAVYPAALWPTSFAGTANRSVFLLRDLAATEENGQLREFWRDLAFAIADISRVDPEEARMRMLSQEHEEPIPDGVDLDAAFPEK